MTGLPPADIEKIAAFLDRRLPEEERLEFLARLDTDEALYEVFVETVRYREEASSPAGEVVEHPASRDWTRWMGPAAIAAMLALVIIGPMVMRTSRAQPDFAALLAQDEELDASLGEAWYEQGWSVMRGELPYGDEHEAAFRAGVRALELELALRLGRLAEAEELTAACRREVAKIDLFDIAELYEPLYEQIEAGDAAQALQAFRDLESTIATDLGDLHVSYAFGTWTETGRLASQRQNESLLRDRTFRESLHDARAQDWNEATERRLELIANQIAQRGTTLDYARLERAFQGIIDSY